MESIKSFFVIEGNGYQIGVRYDWHVRFLPCGSKWYGECNWAQILCLILLPLSGRSPSRGREWIRSCSRGWDTGTGDPHEKPEGILVSVPLAARVNSPRSD